MLQDRNIATAEANDAPLFELRNIQKKFGSVAVLHDLNFQLNAGEIHAFVGENGAGKSTCLGLLYGLYQPSAGGVYRDGQPVRIESPSHAQTLGIGCVFQELSLAGSLSVAENIFAGRAPTRFGIVDWSELRRKAEAVLAEFDLDLDVSAPVDSLPISTRQIVEIAKALSLNSKILLLDEPTSALTPDEVNALFVVLRKLTARGIGIVYVSHHMSEIFEISDRISVLRDGRKISTCKTCDTTQAQVVGEMIGNAHPGDVERASNELGEVVLDVQNLSHPSLFSDISFSIKKGEILGLAGLLGSRRSEIVRAIAGLLQGYSGDISLNGNRSSFSSLRQAMKAGVGFVPEERKTEGLFLNNTLGENLVASSLKQHTKLGILQPHSINEAAYKAIDAFGVKTRGPSEKIGSLSGGNQQKIMLAKWLERSPDLLIIEEPTKGVDVGAKFQIHTELQRRAAEGMAVLVVSSDFPELVSLANRILVIHDGRITGSTDAKDASEDTLLQMAAGLPTTHSTNNNLATNNNQVGF
ncbi:sugar ABC transporter ATP-binding protein [Lentilitoribacter sp. Alg239-R112]|uniref:sugar ABC transporter ATP-binding protein n=1 Tax=Lentilitoribacter sp. Alg239-R112 TaxID=2305987 RepID=UPI001FCE9F85|nr:sugar ABC transporter ATP-binding protein [Lentilitoribacter sp. Alg239-R112]